MSKYLKSKLDRDALSVVNSFLSGDKKDWKDKFDTSIMYMSLVRETFDNKTYKYLDFIHFILNESRWYKRNSQVRRM